MKIILLKSYRLFSVSEFIFSMRLQNGLRHNDAIRYHKYCSRRLSRLRNKLKHKNGRHRFVAKPLPNDFVDERYLHLPLVEAERSYARHLEMQHIQSTPPNPNGLIHTENGNVKVRNVLDFKTFSGRIEHDSINEIPLNLIQSFFLFTLVDELNSYKMN